MTNLIEKKRSQQDIFQGKIVSLSVDTVELPNGKTATREVVRHCPAVCVLAITEDERVILVKQYRYPCETILLEVPAGKMDLEGESPESCALRELAEETPFTAKHIELLHCFYTAPGFCDELMYVYRAHGIEQNSTLSTDEDEFIEIVTLSKQEVREAIRQQTIRDAKTLIALQSWLLND